MLIFIQEENAFFCSYGSYSLTIRTIEIQWLYLRNITIKRDNIENWLHWQQKKPVFFYEYLNITISINTNNIKCLFFSLFFCGIFLWFCIVSRDTTNWAECERVITFRIHVDLIKKKLIEKGCHRFFFLYLIQSD